MDAKLLFFGGVWLTKEGYYILILLAKTCLTKNFDTGFLESLMATEYQLYIIKNDCADVGHFGMARARKIACMTPLKCTKRSKSTSHPESTCNHQTT